MSTLTSIPLTTLSGSPTTLAQLGGKATLIVNVASKCGFTPQYTGLENLHQQFKEKGLTILGVPANDFAAQEPGTNQEIAQFCSLDYPVTFPLLSKASVTGPDITPLYAELTSNAPDQIINDPKLREGLTGFLASQNLPAPAPLPAILWNFEKFLVASDGTILARFAPDIAPDNPILIEAITKALA